MRSVLAFWRLNLDNTCHGTRSSLIVCWADDADETERLKSDLEETHLYYGLQGVLIKSKMHSSCRCRPLTTKSGKETSVDSSCPCETSATGCQGHCAKEWGKLEKQFEMECATDLTPAYQKSVGKSSEMAIFAKRVSTFKGAHEEEALRNAIKERRAVIDRVENELTKRLYGGKWKPRDTTITWLISPKKPVTPLMSVDSLKQQYW